jgi:general secretion pathway protein G
VRRARRAGFSLLELMLVLAIIGVLTAVAAWNIVGMGERAKIRATKASMSIIESAIKAYHLEQSTYPANFDVLVTGKFLEGDKVKDGFGNKFYYQPTNAPEKPFDLVSAGPDGKMATADDIDLWKEKAKEAANP